MLGGFITLAGCTVLKLESSIFYALAFTGFFSGCCGARMYGEAVVPVSYPGRGSMHVPFIALWDLAFLSFCLSSFLPLLLSSL